MKRLYVADNMCTIYKLVLHKVQRTLNDLGYTNVDSPAKADLCLVGLCASFEADEDRSIEILKRVYEAGALVYTYGCMVTVNPSRIQSAPLFPSWDVQGLLRGITGDQRLAWDWSGLPNTFRTHADYRVRDPRKKFVAISTGCNFQCSYCAHRLGTGPLVSVPVDDILDQIRGLNDGETKTVFLTGIDTACYGQDIGTSFATLLDRILCIINPRIDIHIAQFNPEGLRLDSDSSYGRYLLSLFTDPVVRDIQLPIQTTSPRLLTLMNRRYSPDALGRFLAALADAGGTFLRTDLMVGLPTETEDEFIYSVAYARRYFDEIAVYAFEMKKGTSVCGMDLTPVNGADVMWRRKFAMESLGNFGLLVHSGGQDVEGLLANDRAKALRRQADGE